MTVQISIHCWFVQFSTIFRFWIEIISSIESSLAFDFCFESESNMSKIWVRSWLSSIDCSSNVLADNSIWCWYSFRSSFNSTYLTSDILISASAFRFCFSDWYMILKLYSNNFSAHLVCRLISFLMIMKYFKFRWSMKILIEISVHFNLKHQCFCYDSSYASSLIAMLMTMLMTILMTMLMTILRAIVDRSSLEHRLVSKSTLFRVSLCSSESYR